MDSAISLFAVFKPLLWLLPFVLLAALLKSAWFKGRLGESMVRRKIESSLDPSTYHRFDDLLVPSQGGTTQIDHVVVSRYGIFVIETKNMGGWIFGDARQAQWTQTIYRHKQRFQNPLRQNHAHTKALESALSMPGSCFHSVVVFTGDCTFKTEMPKQIRRLSDIIAYIESFSDAILDDSQVIAAVRQLDLVQSQTNSRAKSEHVRALKKRLENRAKNR